MFTYHPHVSHDMSHDTSHDVTCPTGPNVAVGSSDVFTSAGQPTTLVCEVSGTPPPEVIWEKVGEKEKGHGENTQLLEKQAEQPLDKQRFVQLSDHSLFILGTDLQDEGVYIVKATNSGGTVDAMVKVTVTRPVPLERKYWGGGGVWPKGGGHYVLGVVQTYVCKCWWICVYITLICGMSLEVLGQGGK